MKKDLSGVTRMTAAAFRSMMGLGGPVSAPEALKAQIRLPSTPRPNKTEARWMLEAARYWPGCKIEFEPITLRLPSGCRYTPDVVVRRGPEIVAICEVKGPHIHNQRGIHAFKEAKAAFPEWNFHFCQLLQGQWAISPEIVFEKNSATD